MRTALRGVRKYGAIARDVVRAYPWSSPAKLARVAYGRARYGVAPAVSLSLGVIDLPARAWPRFEHHRTRLIPLDVVNQRLGAELFRNKIALLARVAEHGLPHTRTYDIDELPSLGSTELFVKPSDERGGHGAFVAYADEPDLAERARGLLIQRRLRTHPDLTAIGGDLGLSTFRVQTVLTPEGGRVVDIVAKILTHPDLVDNWRGGRTGKLIAGVDLERGTLTGAFGLVAGTEHIVGPVQRHPVTGQRFSGFPLPDFDALIAVGERLAEAFPDAPMLGSDIAITADGPVIVEPNLRPEMNFPQITRREGVRDFLPRWIGMADVPDDVKREAIAILG